MTRYDSPWKEGLSEDLDDQVYAQVNAQTKEKGMTFDQFVVYPERRGEIKGLLKGIEAVLELRFAAAGLALMPEVRKVKDPARLDEVLAAAKTKPDLDEVRK